MLGVYDHVKYGFDYTRIIERNTKRKMRKMFEPITLIDCEGYSPLEGGDGKPLLST